MSQCSSQSNVMGIFIMITSQKEARKFFNSEIKPVLLETYSASDTVAFNEEFNNWVDSMVTDREMPKRALNWTRT